MQQPGPWPDEYVWPPVVASLGSAQLDIGARCPCATKYEPRGPQARGLVKVTIDLTSSVEPTWASAAIAERHAGTTADGARVGVVPAGEAAATAAVGGTEHAVNTPENAGTEGSQGSEGASAVSGLTVAYGSPVVTMAEPPWESEVPQGARGPSP